MTTGARPIPSGGSATLRGVRAARRGMATVSAVMAHLAGWNYIVCALFITFDVLARSLLGFSSAATVEVTSYMLAGGIGWSLAHTLAARAHIRVDVLVNRMGLGFRAAMHVVALVLLAGFTGFAVWAAWSLVDESLMFNAHDTSMLQIPMALPQSIWAVGLTAFLLMIFFLLAESLLALLEGRAAEVDALLGSRSIDDEAEEALEAVAMARKEQHA